MWVAFAVQKLLTFFQQKISAYICVSLDVNFNESLTNDVVRFEQLGPDLDQAVKMWRLIHGNAFYILIDVCQIVFIFPQTNNAFKETIWIKWWCF